MSARPRKGKAPTPPAGRPAPRQAPALHPISARTISFGTVSASVKLYSARPPRRQSSCPVCDEPVDRRVVVKAYEYAKNQLSDEERHALEVEAELIDIAEFVPPATVDPIYFQTAYYLAPGRGGDKAYRLLADAMAQADRGAIAKVILRGKEGLAFIRPSQGGLVLHTMHFADEVRDFGQLNKGHGARIREGELALTLRLIEELSHERFQPDQYVDEDRVLEVEEAEAAAAAPETRQPGKVIDLLVALKGAREKRARGA